MRERPFQSPAYFHCLDLDGRERGFEPAVDVYRAPGGWMIKLDLAGVQDREVRVEVQGSRIVIEGTRRDRVIEEGCSCYSLEIQYSSFRRTIELPEVLRDPQIRLETRDGLLVLRIAR